jgi:protein-L-isoaspartate(D-aspartate) O-methyltransferase
VIHKRKLGEENRGIGMTSPGTRGRLVERLRAHGIRNDQVLKAIMQVPRHEFVDEALSSRAYEDTALPISRGQTISQPWVVAKMTEALLEGGAMQKVLEIGTGSGYQAAVLAHLVPQVFSVERIKELLRIARRRFHALGLHNVHVRHADGHLGWPSQAPFDGIIVTAAATGIPMDLLEQLREGGRLVLPLERDRQQRLLCLEKTAEGFEETDLGGVIFVPMLSGLE